MTFVPVISQFPPCIALQNKLGKENIYPYSIGVDKISVIISSLTKKEKTTKKKEETTKKRKFYKWDFFRTSPKNKWAMLLYSTGSQAHNIIMRSKAKRKGFSLNQKGLYDRKTKKLLSENAKSEKFFFDKLDMVYKNPNMRV